MTNKTLEEQAAVFKALGHPSRLRMVKALAREEKCVCELQALTGGDMSTVSKHLSVLKASGIVATDRRGNNIYYRLALTCLAAVLTCLDGDAAPCCANRIRNRIDKVCDKLLGETTK